MDVGRLVQPAPSKVSVYWRGKAELLAIRIDLHPAALGTLERGWYAGAANAMPIRPSLRLYLNLVNDAAPARRAARGGGRGRARAVPLHINILNLIL